MPKVSIIIPSYNHEKYIKDCIGSVLNQTFQDFEIIITDDGSTDNTVAEIKKFKDGRIKLFCFGKNKGASVAVNNCIANSIGEYIAIINSDDVYVSDKLEKQVDFLEKNNNVGAVLSYISAIDERGNDILDDKIFNFRHFDRGNRTKYEWLQLFFSGENGLAQPSTLIRRSCYFETGMYDERFAQVPDWDFWIRFCMKYDLHVISERLVKYRVRDNNQNISANRPEKNVRINWEISQMLRNFLNINDISEFKKIFPDYLEYELDVDLIPYCIAKEALKSPNESYRHFAIDTLYGIFENKELSLKIEKIFDFSFSDLIKIAGREDLFSMNKIVKLGKIIEFKDTIIQEKDTIIQEKDTIIQEKDSVIQEKEGEILFMKSSIFWKMRSFYLKIKKINLTRMRQLLKNSCKTIKRDGVKKFFIRVFDFLGNKFISSSKYEKKIQRIVVSKKYQKKWNEDLPLVSIVIPCYNYGNFVIETIESAVRQTFQNIEIIVINDGSNDKKTVNVLNSLKYPKTRVIHQKNQGLAQTRNNGMEIAMGKYVCFLDADDIMMPTYIEKAIILLESDENLGCVYSWLQCFGENDSIWKTQDLDPFELRNSNIASSHSVIRKTSWEKVKELNRFGFLTKYNGYFEDWVFWIDMLRVGFGGVVIEEPLIRYRVHKNSLSAIHKSGFKDKLKQLKKDRKEFFYNDKYSKEIQSKIFRKIEIINFLDNINKNSFYLSSQNNNKNILLLMPWLTFGGAEALVFNYAHKLKGSYNFHIITGIKSKNEWEYKFKEVTNNIYHLPNLFDVEEENLEFVLNYIETRDIKIVHIIHNSVFYEMFPHIKKKFPNIKVIVTVFNVLADHFKNSLKNVEYIDKFITDNSLVVKEYGKRGIKCEAIHNGIDCIEKFNMNNHSRLDERKKIDVKNDELAVYFIGRLSPEKNPDIFLNAAKEIVKKHSKVKFFIIGDGPMRREIEKSIGEFNHNNIKYLGYQTDIPRYLSAADVFVLPSKIEGFPLSNLEAMAMGVCVISSNVGGVSDAIEDRKNGFLVNPNSIEALVDKIEFVIKNKGMVDNISKNARKTIEEKFSIEILAKNYNNLYKNINE
ncbi:MAG: glycosyltransferase [Candidatus Moraniibacteriota bacterium]